MKTEKLEVRSLGKLQRRGNRYCGAGCGFGCTVEMFEYAKKVAEAAAKQLGPKWRPVVHENGNWYPSVEYPADNEDGYLLRISLRSQRELDTGVTP